MADYITLLGAEDVSRASSRMKEAAHQMEQAASSIAYSMEVLDRIVGRIEEAMARTIEEEIARDRLRMGRGGNES